MTPIDLIVPTFTQLLTALSGWLSKAEQQRPGADWDALLAARLIADMHPLSTQIRFACIQVHEAVYRLQGQPLPASHTELLEEARNGGQRPGSLAEAQARISEALELLKSLSAAPDPGTPLAHQLPNGMIFDFTVEEYARDWLLAQFYFHLMAAYAILRSQGVDIGKKDFIPHLLSKLRPETMPKG
jgi:uncharacterized protein